MLRPLIAGIVTLALLAVACGGGGGKSSRPNILLIITDDQRYGTVAQFMPETQKRIFDQGVSFDKAFVTTPLCCPSRASILTGMYAHTTGVHDNPDPLEKPTFVQHLHEAGYYTGLVGKYLNSWNMNRPRKEFDSWVSAAPGSNEYYNFHLNVNGKLQQSPYYITEVEKEYGLQFIDDAATRDQPFALMFATAAPHEPAIPRIGDETLYAGLPPYRPPSYNEKDVSDKPSWPQLARRLNRQEQRETDLLRLHQLQSLKHVDRTIATLMDELQKNGQLDNTVVIFISDNGLFWGEHRLTGKVFPYEEAIHVPMAVRYPKIASVPAVVNTIVGNIDIAPTIYELAGIDQPPEVDGVSLLPLLKGTQIDRRDLLIEGWPGEGHFAGLRTDRYMYIETHSDLSELYDLQTDPAQLESKAADPTMAALINQMSRRLHELEGQAPLSPGQTLPAPLTTDGAIE